VKLDISFKECDGYLLVHVKGKWTVYAVSEGIEDVFKKAQELGHTRILLDIRELSAPQTDLHRFFAGKKKSKNLTRDPGQSSRRLLR
jgi:hypothetical protein